MKIALFLTVVISSCLLYGLLGPRLEAIHRQKINAQMKQLSDLVKMSPSDRNALNTLIKKLGSRDSFERFAAVAYLGKAGPAAEPAVDDLVHVLNGNDLYAARQAAVSLGEIGPKAERATPALLGAIRRYPSSDIGWFSAKALGQVASVTNIEVETMLNECSQSQDTRMNNSAKAGIDAFQFRRSQAGRR